MMAGDSWCLLREGREDFLMLFIMFDSPSIASNRQLITKERGVHVCMTVERDTFAVWMGIYPYIYIGSIYLDKELLTHIGR